ncbi:MAG TPA: GlsB/YeaQ/YmgE family stress response membrane protein [Candidatus Eisenbacteria bacterium]|nr:GlsB/YeaQ/YmgE family stress response membrane protein [Candidatus Eisenbacteria bacterium]
MGDILIYVVVGLIAGFLASRVVLGKGRGWFLDIVIGILGAILGNWLADLLHISIGYGIFGKIVVAFVGALILLILWRLLFRRRKH